MTTSPASDTRMAIGPILGAVRQRFRSVLRPLALPAVLYAVLIGVGDRQAGDIGDLTAGTIVVSLLAASIGGALIFALGVWMLRRAAPDLGIRPTDVGAGAVLASGAVTSAVVFVGLLLLVIPGLVAAVLLFCVLPIVAYEGRGVGDAMRASVDVAKRHPGTICAALLLLILGPALLDPATWMDDAFGSAPILVGAWQVLLHGGSVIAGTIIAAEIWRRGRVPQLLAAATPAAPAPPLYPPTDAPVQHAYTAPGS